MGRREGKGEGWRRKGPKKRGGKWVKGGEVEGVDIAWPDLYLTLHDATAAASGPNLAVAVT